MRVQKPDNDVSCSCESPVKEKKSARSIVNEFREPILSTLLFILAYILEFYSEFEWKQYVFLGLMFISYWFVAKDVLKKAGKLIRKGDLFNEFTLMSLATLGAFYIGDYLEGVFVMLFYTTGEIIQGMAVSSARRSIRNLLELNVTQARKVWNGEQVECHPEEVKVGEVLLVKPGELIALDGIYLEDDIAFVDASNISGESLPMGIRKGEKLIAGMLCLEHPIKMEVSAIWKDSHINKIMTLVEESSKRKAKTQRLISRLAKVYTPIVFALAFLLVSLPFFFDPSYQFEKWFYRGLVFLVISCPCAFLIAIPLSYFGGIGLAAKNGILFKGGEILERMAKLKALVFDKTGTLTDGAFTVNKQYLNGNEAFVLAKLYEIEKYSNHPLSNAVIQGFKQYDDPNLKAQKIKETSGKGIEAEFDGVSFRAGTKEWLNSLGVQVSSEKDKLPTIHIAIDQEYKGKIDFKDKAKLNAKKALKESRDLGVKFIAMLSGDRKNIAEEVGRELELDQVYAELLPEDKVSKYSEIKENNSDVAFVGDGVNDAPVIAMADVGIAMGNRGSDAAIQNADVIIEKDDLGKIPLAMEIARLTQKNVFQNLTFAIIVKVLVLTLGALGIAGLWEAIFADVGVALLVVLHAYSLKNKNGIIKK